MKTYTVVLVVVLIMVSFVALIVSAFDGDSHVDDVPIESRDVTEEIRGSLLNMIAWSTPIRGIGPSVLSGFKHIFPDPRNVWFAILAGRVR